MARLDEALWRFAAGPRGFALTMFRIRRIYDDLLPANQAVIEQAQQILREQFHALPVAEIEQFAEKMSGGPQGRFRPSLYVGENGNGRVLGFALLLHNPQQQFCYLDFLASAPGGTGRGIGGALYERVRDEARRMGAKGIFFECLPDDSEGCPDPAVRKANAARLAFYERYGARPIINTAYRAPINPGDTNLPHLVFDGLDRPEPLRRRYLQLAVRTILEEKYSHLCPPEYIDMVVRSIKDDPVQLRLPRYLKQEPARPQAAPKIHDRIALVINDKHDIHHVRERGYVEAPVRIDLIRTQLATTELFETIRIQRYSEKYLTTVHDRNFVNYVRRACASVPQGKSVYPYVFPIRNPSRRPKELSVQAGYYCIDTFTPLNRNAYLAAKRAVDCALTAADEILKGRRLAYALVRPPGHHAERRSFGGFCYFNNAAVAAQRLSHLGKVAILDLDYHHGNGQQDIFYDRADVLTVSIHGSPRFAYPYFTGFAKERGTGAGQGFNLNIPLPEIQDGPQYLKALQRALNAVVDFKPTFLVVPLGLDLAKGDPTGTFSLMAKDFEANGRLVGELALPTLVVQEGGYRTRTLGTNARSFFQGLMAGALAK